MGKLKSSAQRVAEQWPFFRYLGIGAWWAWVWTCYSSSAIMTNVPVDSRPDLIHLMYLLSTVGIASMLVCAAITYKRSTVFFTRPTTTLASAVFAALGTLAVGYSGLVGGMPLFVVGAVATGLATAGLCLRAGYVYGSLPLRESMTACGVSLVFASMLYFVVVGSPVGAQVAFAAALPLVSALLLVMPGDDPFPAEDARLVGIGDVTGRATFYRMLSVLAVVAFTSGTGKGLAAHTLTASQISFVGTVIVLIIMACGVVVVLMANGNDLVHSTQRIYALMMFFGIVVLVLGFFGADISILDSGNQVIWAVFSALLAFLAFRFDAPALRVFGFGQAAYFVFSTVGWTVGAVVADCFEPSYYQPTICILFAFLIVMLLTLVFRDSDIAFLVEPHKRELEDGRVGGPTEEAILSTLTINPESPFPLSLHERIELAGGRFNLTARECEVLEMFAAGRSANWIADNLVVSKNTVRSHIRSSYVKLDIHNRQELLDVLGEE